MTTTLAEMETARHDVALCALRLWAVRDYEGGDVHRQTYNELMAACETYAATRDMVIE